MANNKLDDTPRFGAEVLLDGQWDRGQTLRLEYQPLLKASDFALRASGFSL